MKKIKLSRGDLKKRYFEQNKLLHEAIEKNMKLVAELERLQKILNPTEPVLIAPPSIGQIMHVGGSRGR